MILQIFAALTGSLGFGIMFHVKGPKLAVIAAGGAACWIFYLCAMQWQDSQIIAFFLSALITAVLAELLARRLKAPVPTLLMPMLIPLVPGSDLYYTAIAFVGNDMAQFVSFGERLVKESGAMSFGVLVAAGIAQIVIQAQRRFRIYRTEGNCRKPRD